MVRRRRGGDNYYALLHGVLAKKDIANVRTLHLLIVQHGLFFDPILCSHTIRLYASFGYISMAYQMFLQIPSSSVYTWSAIISSLSHAKQGMQALALFQEMQRTNENGMMLDKHVFLAVLKGCSNVLALRLIHFLIVQDGLQEDVALSNCLIDTYAKCKCLLDARRVFDEQEERDTITWSSLMIGYAQNGYGHDVIMLYSKMSEEGIEPNRVTILSVLKACSTFGLLVQCVCMHLCLLEKGFEHDLVLGNTLIDVYAKCGNIKEAHRVFLKLSKQDAVSWNALIGAYIQHGHDQKAFGLFNKMYWKDIKPDKFTVVRMLKACSGARTLIEGRLMYAYFIESGFSLDDFIINALIDMYAKCGDLHEAQILFDRLPERSIVTWSAMIAGHVQSGQNYEALDVFLQMQKEKKNPDNFTYGSILKACANMNALNKGKVIHEHIIENNAKLNVVVGGALIDMYIKCNSLEDARLLFDRLSTRDVVTWSALISGYVQLGSPQEALGLYQLMMQEHIAPNGVTFMSSLKACSNLVALYEGTLIHSQIIENGLELENLICNTLIDMYGKCGNLRDAYKVFSYMSNRDVVSWNALISGFALQSNYESALRLFESMQQEGLRPDDITFLSLLSVCNHLGLVKEGQHHFMSMGKVFDITPDLEHYNCMIDLFGRSGHFKEALDLLQLIPSESGTVGWGSLLTNCSNHGNSGLGRQCFNSVVHMDLSHATAYVHIFNIYGNHEMWEEARKIVELRSSMAFGWKKPGKAWIEVGSKIFDFIVGDQSHQQSLELFAKLNRLTKALTIEGHVPHFMSMIPSISERKETSF